MSEEMRETENILLKKLAEADFKLAALRARCENLEKAANHAYSEWDGGSHEEAIVAMRKLKQSLEVPRE